MTKINETVVGAQGEVRIYKMDRLPNDATVTAGDRIAQGVIISHSESGHHHILAGDCDLMEAPDVIPGMRVFYAILKSPGRLFQDAPEPHGEYQFEAGDIIKFEIDIEFNPFAEEARRSAD